MVSSFRFRWVILISLDKLLSITAKPWFWLVISTVLVSKFLTGWLHPRCPNLSLKVFAPNERASIWWPKQIPNIGFIPRRDLTVLIAYMHADGSPGPFDKNIPSGL